MGLLKHIIGINQIRAEKKHFESKPERRIKVESRRLRLLEDVEND
jgi:hypothetical protein